MGFIAPFVPAIAGGLGALFGSGGGDAARQDYRTIRSGQNSLKDIASYTTPLGKTQASLGTANTQSGMGSLDQVKQYWTGILSGSRPAQMAAAAPEINAINEADAAQRAKEGAFGTSRGGGTNAAAQSAETQRMSDINNAIFATRPAAAQGLTTVGKAQADVGLQQMSNGLRAIGLSEDAVKAIIDSAMGSRTTSADINDTTLTRIGEAIGSLPWGTIFGSSSSGSGSTAGTA
jgi:hypothetical protein